MELLLDEFDLGFLQPELEAAGIEFRHLPYLNEKDIANAIKKIGPRAEFREKLFKWRKNMMPDFEKQMLPRRMLSSLYYDY